MDCTCQPHMVHAVQNMDTTLGFGQILQGLIQYIWEM